tara:strand:- start:263 stop:1003 length:741 start_codon:yes stop_codon:yes gene_type:complete
MKSQDNYPNQGQGDSINNNLSSWSFDSNVPENFDAHVSKSVPGYKDGHDLITLYSDFFVNLPSKRVYDIGSSTGCLIQNIQSRHPKKELSFIGIEPSENMVKISSKRDYHDPNNVEFLNDYVNNINLLSSSFIVSYYTIQFISPGIRQKVFNQIYDSLDWGGGFFLFEKVRSPDARFQDYTSQSYQEFKINNGYKMSEIISKSRSLKGILEPFTSAANEDFLARAGFKDFEVIFKSFCFQGWLAIK